MELAQNLVRSVIRAFYDTRHILVVDALVIHHCLRDDELSYLIGMNPKDLHKLCASLRDARFLVVHTRSELREGQQRPVNRTYYYIDYRQTIDAVKWRVYKLTKEVQGVTVPANERKEYFCPRCKAEWTQMEVLDSVGPNGFLCHRCGSVLTHDVERQAGGHERSTRLNNQIRFITDLLPKIDNVGIPENTFDTAYAIRRPIERSDVNPGYNSIAVDPATMRPTAVKGLANTGPRSIEVSISTSEGPTEEEKEAEQQRRERIAKQNALPSWMSNSTVTGEAFSLNSATGVAVPKAEEDSKDHIRKESMDAKEHAALDDYFARLKAEQAAEAARKAAAMEEESEDEDEDEGDFEDVVATGSSSADVVPKESSASASNVDIPSSSQAGPTSEEPPTKKIKEEAPAQDGDSDDEEIDFVDV